MKTSFLHILIIICAVVWSLGAQAQRSIDLINDNDRVQLCEIIHRSDLFKLVQIESNELDFEPQNTDNATCFNVI